MKKFSCIFVSAVLATFTLNAQANIEERLAKISSAIERIDSTIASIDSTAASIQYAAYQIKNEAQNGVGRYKVYPTENVNISLKLDTKTGYV